MSQGVFFYTDELQHYDMGPQHPLKPIRLRRTHELLLAYGALDNVSVETPKPATLDDLRTTHSEEFIRAVDYLGQGRRMPDSYRRFGFGAGDNPIFPDMYDASALYTGASVDAARAILDGRCRFAMNISGGLHHAHWGRAAGFCVFNDCAVAIRRLRRKFARVAYIDIDVHHGDGVQEAFYDDPTVLTISIHETGQTLFPGTGFPREIGQGEGEGYSVNVPVWPYTEDETWLRAFREAALQILKAFDPEAICLQLGADAHHLDPLAHVALTAQGWLEAVRDVKALGKPIVALGGGGYNQTTVPRMWTLAFGELFDVELPDVTPESFSWHERIPTLTDHEPPFVSPEVRAEADEYAQHTIDEVRRLLFHRFGL